MGNRRIAPVVAVLCAAALGAAPAGAFAHGSSARHGARYPNEPTAVGTGGAVASMDVGASRAGITCSAVAATRSTPPSQPRARSG